MKLRLLIFALPLLLIACAQNNEAIKNSIFNLNEEIVNLQKSLADIKVNVDDLDRRISTNEEKINENANAISQVRGDMAYVTNELTIMKKRLEESPSKMDYGRDDFTKKPTERESDNQIIILEDFTDKTSLYSYAYELFKAGKLFESKAKFEEFLALYPNDELSDNAMYWIAEVYYTNNEYQKTIETLEELIKKYPNENKVPDAYVKIALAKSKLGDIEGAKEILKKVITNYPDTNAANVAKERLRVLE